MEPLATAGAFATIIGLLCNFKSERKGKKLDEFILWLKEKHHEDIISYIQSQDAVTNEITTLLAREHEEVISRLDQLDAIISTIAAHLNQLPALAISIHPHALISNQAFSVLKQLVKSGAKYLLEDKSLRGEYSVKYLLMEGARGEIKCDEPRFIEDDVESLQSLGLLRLEYGSRGSKKYYVTRSACSFIESANR